MAGVKHKCAMCGKRLSSKESLIRHQVLHNAMKTSCSPSSVTKLTKRNKRGLAKSINVVESQPCSSNSLDSTDRLKTNVKMTVKAALMTKGVNLQPIVVLEKLKLDPTQRRWKLDQNGQIMNTPTTEPKTSTRFDSIGWIGSRNNSKVAMLGKYNMQLKVNLERLPHQTARKRKRDSDDEVGETTPKAQPTSTRNFRKKESTETTSEASASISSLEGEKKLTRQERWLKRHPSEEPSSPPSSVTSPRLVDNPSYIAYQKAFWNNYYRSIKSFAPESINPNYRGALMNSEDSQPFRSLLDLNRNLPSCCSETAPRTQD